MDFTRPRKLRNVYLDPEIVNKTELAVKGRADACSRRIKVLVLTDIQIRMR